MIECPAPGLICYFLPLKAFLKIFISITFEIKLFSFNIQISFDQHLSPEILQVFVIMPSCCHPNLCKKIVTHQVCGPDYPYCGPALCTPTQYLYWSSRPIITYTSTTEVKNTWNLKRRTANSADVYYQEMYDRCGIRYFWEEKENFGRKKFSLLGFLRKWNKKIWK